MQMLAVVLFSTNILAVLLAVSHFTHYKNFFLKKTYLCARKRLLLFSLLIFCPDEDASVVVSEECSS